MVRPSTGNIGRSDDDEPVAIMTSSAWTNVSSPSTRETRTVWSFTSRPVPWTCRTPQLLNNAAMPFTSPFTIRSLRATICAGTYAGGVESRNPSSSAFLSFSPSSTTDNSALLGMHPQLRHTPPNAWFSITVTLHPRCAARIAATYPPGPAPRTAICFGEGINVVRREIPRTEKTSSRRQRRRDRLIRQPRSIPFHRDRDSDVPDDPVIRRSLRRWFR